MQGLPSPELVFHGAEVLVIALVSWLNLKIQSVIKDKIADVRDEQGRVKEELVENQTKLHLEFNEKHGENQKAIAVHSASDDQQFAGILRALARIDQKLEKIANGH